MKNIKISDIHIKISGKFLSHFQKLLCTPSSDVFLHQHSFYFLTFARKIICFQLIRSKIILTIVTSCTLSVSLLIWYLIFRIFYPVVQRFISRKLFFARFIYLRVIRYRFEQKSTIGQEGNRKKYIFIDASFFRRRRDVILVNL